ncbi:hypothetical protein SO802_030908 [Lithocarpus litseifolius]|uniref:Reverse transcriptase zinc-binding domain-containing protein n=1 Tax=Lithocarpus litseifolius TaxID=425828 RepID=A0AAW2BLA3_9ROSI
MLKNLSSLDSSNSGFAGQIPIEISCFTRLVTLNLSTDPFLSITLLKIENPNLAMIVQNVSQFKELYLDGVNVSPQRNQWSQALSSSQPNLSVKHAWYPCPSQNLDNFNLPTKTVANLINHSNGTWNPDLVRNIYPYLISEDIMTNPISRTGSVSDKLLWKYSNSGVFKVKNASKLLQDDHNYTSILANIWYLIWKVKLPLKIGNFIWKLMHNSLPTFLTLKERGITNTSTCPLCNSDEESTSHLVLYCSFARAMCMVLIKIAGRKRKQTNRSAYEYEAKTVQGNCIFTGTFNCAAKTVLAAAQEALMDAILKARSLGYQRILVLSSSNRLVQVSNLVRTPNWQEQTMVSDILHSSGMDFYVNCFLFQNWSLVMFVPIHHFWAPMLADVNSTLM